MWAFLVPEALAYATTAGVAPVNGPFAAIPSRILYAAAGSSRHLVVGPMSATAAMSAAIFSPIAGPDYGRFPAPSAALATSHWRGTPDRGGRIQARAALAPGALVAVELGIGLVAVLGLHFRGVAIVGQIDWEIPALALPEGLSLGEYGDLLGPADRVMLIGFVEGLGASILGSEFTSGMVVAGSWSKTAVDGGAGARTQLSGLVGATLVIPTLLFLTG